MNHANTLGAVAIAAAGSIGAASAVAQDAAAPAPAVTVTAPAAARSLGPGLGAPVDATRLAAKRGGNGALSDMQLRGVVSDNRAVNVATGANAISDGAFSGMAGLPMVVQNTGNNVLIQNATIINVHVK
jgi:hypothetical protein